MRAYLPDPDFQGKLEQTDEYKAGLTAIAQDIRGRAHYVTRQFMPNKDTSDIVVATDGDEVYVSNTDHGAHLDEWGSVNNPAYAPMRTAVRAAGLRLEES